MKHQIVSLLSAILAQLGYPGVTPEVTVPEDPAHGDYTTNVAMKLAGTAKKQPASPQGGPMEIALSVKERMENGEWRMESNPSDQNIGKRGHSPSPQLPLLPILQAISRVEVAAPGFINVFLSEASLISQLQQVLKQKETYAKPPSYVIARSEATKQSHKGVRSLRRQNGLAMTKKTIMVEFAHPNTHKAFHIGHLRNITTGESIIRLLESQGHRIVRANYQGDVGMHIAKCLYGILRVQSSKFKVQSWKEAAKLSIQKRVEYLGEMYAAGSKAFEEDAAAKDEIVSLNALIYASAQAFARERGIDPGTTDYLSLAQHSTFQVEQIRHLWQETRQWSLDYFEMIYTRVGSRYDRYYFESECLAGVDLAREAVKKGVLKEDAGAIIFDGKPYGVDTRVFVNQLGLPTYEGKELKLATMETTEFGPLDRLIHVVGPEQASFFAVTFKTEELLGMVKPGVQHHLVYGWVKLKHGKMSSRTGNVVLGEWLLDEAKKEIYKILEKSDTKGKETIAEKAAIAAVKYAFLKVSTTSEIAFDIAESVNFQGDSGPYLQYTYARCRSVLRKAPGPVIGDLGSLGDVGLNAEERMVARLLVGFPDLVKEATETFSPSMLCTYLFKLAQAFNLFYAKHQIVQSVKSKEKSNTFMLDASCSSFRLALTAATSQVLKNGLYLLGIETLEHM